MATSKKEVPLCGQPIGRRGDSPFKPQPFFHYTRREFLEFLEAFNRRVPGIGIVRHHDGRLTNSKFCGFLLQIVRNMKKALIQIQDKVKLGKKWQERKEQILKGAEIITNLASNLPEEQKDSVTALLLAVTV